MTAASPVRVDVWWVRTKDVHHARTLRACEALLTPDDRRRRDAFVFEQNRHEYLVTRALVRGVLAGYLGMTPQELAFARNAHGRPELSPASGARFNLSNTVDFVVCAVTHGRDLGVDIETIERADDILQLASTVFTDGERGMLAQLALEDRRRRGVELWTLKEAYIKARGLGMSLAVERIEVDVDAGAGRLRFFSPIDDDASRWALSTRALEEHVVSICVDTGGAPAEITFHAADLDRIVG